MAFALLSFIVVTFTNAKPRDMQKKTFILGLCFCLFSIMAIGQYKEAPDGLGVRAVFPNYQWAVDQEFIEDEFGAGIELEYVRHLNSFLNFGLPIRLNNVVLPPEQVGRTNKAAMLGLDATLQLKFFREPAFLYPYLLAGIGLNVEDFEEVGLEAPLGIGLNFRIGKHAYISTRGEYRVSFQDARDHLQLGAGMHFIIGDGEPAPPVVIDSDDDGVPDSQDLCPTVAGVIGLNGCPDSDGDGVTDGDDKCPNTAGLVALAGCPDTDSDGVIDQDDDCPTEAGPAENGGCPIKDADGDGVLDDVDECPNVAGTVATNGCPDTDGDGIANAKDNCPNAAGPAATNGCPDADADGVIDSEDRCPDSKGPASNNGCPEITEEDKETLDLAVQAVQFQTGNAELKSNSTAILDQIVEILGRYRDYQCAINGHTDSIGSSKTNQRLSEQRAKACYDYLISKGIDASRLSFTGYGEAQPISDNRYKAGRDQNRRVEFNLFLK